MSARAQRISPHGLAETAFRLRELGIFVAFALTVVFFSVRATNFATAGNWRDIATDVSIVIVVAVGETMVILTRNIDLSVGSIVGLTAYVSSNTLADHHGMPLVATAALAMLVGLACGIGNGLLVAVGRIPAIIATLATLAIYRGVLFQVTHGQNVFASQLPQNFLDFAAKTPAGVPSLAWIAIGVALVGAPCCAGLRGRATSMPSDRTRMRLDSPAFRRRDGSWRRSRSVGRSPASADSCSLHVSQASTSSRAVASNSTL